MENKDCIVKKIDELKEVDVYELLYYAYDIQLIDDQFLIDYAMAQFEKNPSLNDSFILELAGLLDYEVSKAGKILEDKITDKDLAKNEKGLYYNKMVLSDLSCRNV